MFGSLSIRLVSRSVRALAFLFCVPLFSHAHAGLSTAPGAAKLSTTQIVSKKPDGTHVSMSYTLDRTPRVGQFLRIDIQLSGPVSARYSATADQGLRIDQAATRAEMSAKQTFNSRCCRPASSREAGAPGSQRRERDLVAGELIATAVPVESDTASDYV